MNIFFVDKNPRLAAQALCDKHVVKMTLESAQILSTVLRGLGDQSVFLYKPTHGNHPCVIWARTNKANYKWLVRHAKALSEEYTFRYGKVHKSSRIIDYCYENIPYMEYIPFLQNLPDSNTISPPAQAILKKFKHEDPVDAYRQYYIHEKLKKMVCIWTKRPKPNWLSNSLPIQIAFYAEYCKNAGEIALAGDKLSEYILENKKHHGDWIYYYGTPPVLYRTFKRLERTTRGLTKAHIFANKIMSSYQQYLKDNQITLSFQNQNKTNCQCNSMERVSYS
jgi:hypothetical protein